MVVESMSVQKQKPPTYKFECPFECRTWSGDDLAQIADSVAWHWNKEHNSELEHRFTRIDTVERGGHHVHGNEYTVERIPIYITSFDVMNRLGLEDGRAVQPDGEAICRDCYRYLPDSDERVDVDPDAYYPRYRCVECDEQHEIAEKQQNNQQLEDFK